jgi:hypothetical protein
VSDTPFDLTVPPELKFAIATGRIDDDPERWVDWEQEAEERTAMYEAALTAGCTELQATTLVQLAAGVSARAIARHRGVKHNAVLGLRDRAMARILKEAASKAAPARGDYWETQESVNGLTAKQRYVMSMRDWHGHRLTYIAANMGITRQSVWRIYQRAIKASRRRVDRRRPPAELAHPTRLAQALRRRAAIRLSPQTEVCAACTPRSARRVTPRRPPVRPVRLQRAPPGAATGRARSTPAARLVATSFRRLRPTGGR